MSATDELRALLDERGVDYRGFSEGTYWGDDSAGLYKNSVREGADGLLNVHIHDLTPAQAVEATLGPKITGDTSDGYHTFNELYHHRAVLFSVIVRDHSELAWKARRHHDGTMYDGMFIVGVNTPQGQATYHYDIDPYWKMFECRELDRAPEWDGHTPDDAIARIAALGRGKCKMCLRDDLRGHAYQDTYECSVCGEQIERGTVMGESEPPKFCPNCGREVER